MALSFETAQTERIQDSTTNEYVGGNFSVPLQ